MRGDRSAGGARSGRSARCAIPLPCQAEPRPYPDTLAQTAARMGGLFVRCIEKKACTKGPSVDSKASTKPDRAEGVFSTAGDLRFLQQPALSSRRPRIAAAEVRACPRRGDAALRRTRQETLLDEVRLVDLLDGVALLADGGRQRVQPDRTARELVDDGEQQRAVHAIEAG